MTRRARIIKQIADALPTAKEIVVAPRPEGLKGVLVSSQSNRG